MDQDAREPLESLEIRVLGALIEKEVTTPDHYPLSLNALIAACNQKSNREPIMELDAPAVEAALGLLRRQRYVLQIHGSDMRVPKYRQTWTQALDLSRSETALMCLLMLRGPQTLGELRSRSGRLYNFKDLADVELTLNGLLERETGPLVALLPRQTGFKERRYAHTLSGDPTIETATADPDAASRNWASSAPGPGSPALLSLIHI